MNVALSVQSLQASLHEITGSGKLGGVSQEQSDTEQQHQAQTTAAVPEQAHGKAGAGAEQMHPILEI